MAILENANTSCVCSHDVHMKFLKHFKLLYTIHETTKLNAILNIYTNLFTLSMKIQTNKFFLVQIVKSCKLV